VTSEIPLATANTLIDDATQISGLSRPTIKAYVHQLRDAGLIGPTGPGGAAAPISENDAAALLAAALAQPTIACVAETTARVLNLRLHSVRFAKGAVGKLFWADRLTSLGPEILEHMATFGEALRYLLRCAEDFCTQDEGERTGLAPLFGPNKNGSKIKIAYYRPAETAFITVKFSRFNRLQIKFSDSNACRFDEDDDPEINAYARSVLKRINPP